MGRIERFEDIEAWQKARALTKLVYHHSDDGSFSRDFPLRDQMRRAAVSVMSNIAEGFNRGGNREFVHFLSIAKGSAAEIQSQLYVALDAGHLDQDRFREAYELAAHVANLLGGFIRYLNATNQRGSKFAGSSHSSSEGVTT